MSEFFVVRDLFEFFRLWLATIVTVYFTIVTAQSLWGWYVWLAGSDRYMSMVRRYLLVHGLRLRVSAFWGDVLVCGLLCIAFIMIWHAQGILDHMEQTLKPVPMNHVAKHARHS
jgi:hypothetical protein